MKWFKHMSDTRIQELGSWIIEEYGMDWYGRFWVILETIALKVSDEDDFSCSLSVYDWTTKLKCKHHVLLRFLLDVAQVSDIQHECKHNQIIIKYPKMQNYRDNHTNNAKSKKETCKSLASKEEDKEKELELDKEKELDKDIKEKNIKKEKPVRQKPEQESIPYEPIVLDLNRQLGTQYRHTTKDIQELIRGRWNEGFREPDFARVVENMKAKWGLDPKMRDFLRPSTLFQASKFQSYLNTQITLADRGIVSHTTIRNLEVGKSWLERKRQEEKQAVVGELNK